MAEQIDHLSVEPPPPDRVEVLVACETLLRAGFTQEALTVLVEMSREPGGARKLEQLLMEAGLWDD